VTTRLRKKSDQSQRSRETSSVTLTESFSKDIGSARSSDVDMATSGAAANIMPVSIAIVAADGVVFLSLYGIEHNED
jgi:hypothetical protein